MKDSEKRFLLQGVTRLNHEEPSIELNELINTQNKLKKGKKTQSGYQDSSLEPFEPQIKQEKLTQSIKGLTISWKGITVTTTNGSGSCPPCWKKKIPPAPKKILKDVSGVVKAGSLLMIMGASGSGKTTLLNCLTRRNLGTLQVEGTILINGQEVEDISSISSYIQQDDLFIESLNVKEHLWFNAKLRMGKDTSDEERHQKIEEVIQEMGLKKCEDVMIGGPTTKKGLSGGEKKRLAFAAELLTQPSILFCDEPTSGLDSFMAQQVIQSLKTLTQAGKTVLCTIHQPSSEVFAMFDEILLMAEGRVAYMGPTKDVKNFFYDIGYRCPVNFNPADYYIHKLAIVPEQEIQCKEAVSRVCDEFYQTRYKRAIDFAIEQEERLGKDKYVVQIDMLGNDNSEDLNGNKNKKRKSNLDKKSCYGSSWLTQFRMCLWRAQVDARRMSQVLPGRMIHMLVSALLIGSVYFQQTHDMTGVSNINSALFMIMLEISFDSAFPIAIAFSREFPVFLKESMDKQYTTSAYYMGKILIDLPAIGITAALYTTFCYWMIGLYPSPTQFFIAVAALIIISETCVSYGHLSSAIFPTPELALTILPFMLGIMLIVSGYLIKYNSINNLLKPFAWLSSFGYTFEILLVNQWENVQYIDCEFTSQAQNIQSQFDFTNGLPSNASVESTNWCYPNGMAIIESYQYNKDFLPECFIINLLIFFIIELLGYIFLKQKLKRRSDRI